MNPVDPFAFKSLSKLDPRRLAFTALARLQERMAGARFSSYAVPLRSPNSGGKEAPAYDSADTAVTPPQMQALLDAVQVTNALKGSVVEIGAYRGVTTAILAGATARDYIAVDPYIGYGGADSDLKLMKQRTAALPHVRHLRMTSGEASLKLAGASLSLVFVDAVHDYVNALFDGCTWGEKLTPGGLIAFHDTDSKIFAGVQRAVWEILTLEPRPYDLYAHVEGLIILQKKASGRAAAS